LRPATLDYGLPAALRDLADSLAGRSQSDVTIQFDLPANGQRYPARVEQHLYRIVQQAVENALKHASAQTVCIGGRFDAEQIPLFVEDDGKGFAAGESLDVSGFLARKQFGLAGMIERARLIGAGIQIISSPGRGTQVRILWSYSNEVV
jgi:two-component system, NarL family, sensor histidine kinase DegS